MPYSAPIAAGKPAQTALHLHVEATHRLANTTPATPKGQMAKRVLAVCPQSTPGALAPQCAATLSTALKPNATPIARYWTPAQATPGHGRGREKNPPLRLIPPPS